MALKKILGQKSSNNNYSGLVMHITIFALLMLLMGIMFYVRTVPLYTTIFTDWPGKYGNFVNFALDDAVYHMRLAHNMFHHFPHQVFFDPFVEFPDGAFHHFGPLFSLMIIVLSWIIGLGRSTHQLINYAGAYLPAILGSLCLIPTYFIGKKLCGRIGGIMSALVLAFSAGTFLKRSALGYADHHVAETFFLTLTLAFMLYAIEAAKTYALDFAKIKNKNFAAIKVPLCYSILTGIAFGLYILAWLNGLALGSAIFFTSLILIMAIEHLEKNSLEYLVVFATIVLLVALIVIAPYSFSSFNFLCGSYCLSQPLILLSELAVIWISYGISKHLTIKKAKIWLYPIYLLIFLMLCGAAWYMVKVKFTDAFCGNKFHELFGYAAGMATIAEVKSIFINAATGQFSLASVWHNFFWAVPMSFVAILMLAYRIFKKHYTFDIIFFIWTSIILLAMSAQNRFAYYFVINAAVLSGYFGYSVYKAAMVNYSKNPKKSKFSKIRFTVLWVLFFTILSAYPLTPLLGNAAIKSRLYSLYIPHEWYDTLWWLKNHTPDPQGKVVTKDFDYTAGMYAEPASNETFHYPASAYGVLSWWDYGHDISYVAERIPNANPFQQGIVSKNGTVGVAPFLLATDESVGLKNLAAMGTKYVLIDNDTIASKFYSLKVWAQDNDGWLEKRNISVNSENIKSLQVPIDAPKFYNTMINRLYYNDGNGLEHFRLVYESDGQYLVSAKILDLRSGRLNWYFTLAAPNYSAAQKMLLAPNEAMWLIKNAVLLYDCKPPVKLIKIFEKVNGAAIVGKASSGETVSLALHLQTKDGRDFIYQQQTKAQDGQYKFVVPYPTEPMQGDDYSYDIKPVSQYAIMIGKTTKNVSVSEQAVVEGLVVNVGGK